MSSKYGNEVKDFDHVALRPPSMDVDVPVILSAPGEQRYIINDAIYKNWNTKLSASNIL